jgi:hypothetical protein
MDTADLNPRDPGKPTIDTIETHKNQHQDGRISGHWSCIWPPPLLVILVRIRKALGVGTGLVAWRGGSTILTAVWAIDSVLFSDLAAK